LISIQNVSKWFGKFKAIDSVNIEVKKGEIFGLLGLNGAGKTTTQRMVSTVFQPTKGEILVNGFNSKNDSSEVRKNIGFLPTEVGLYDRLTAREVIRYFGILNDIEENQINDKIDVILEKLSLTEYADKRCSKLSRGNKQKVAIARAIIHEPQVFIFDEPTSGLDVISSRAVLDFVKQCKEDGRTILYSSHSMYETEEICDRISIIHDGKILMTNSIKKIQKEYESLENAFISIVKDEKSWE
jgi:sodium transport system ATP-binding protein|tara:strand:- start:5233 stop:5958 length:726 start_codon:yes stop_codon:yes gene_type:complete